MSTPRPVVVGHDGSSFSDDALRWALHWAARTGLEVVVVRSWSITTAPRPATAAAGYVPPLTDYADAVRERLRADTATLCEASPEVPVRFEAAHGAATNRLVALSKQAELLVVGPRGRGGFRGLVLGSVAEQVSRHAHCPVVVVRGTTDPAEADRTMVLDGAFDDGAFDDGAFEDGTVDGGSPGTGDPTS